jgi:hypothetical protein
MKMVPGSWLPLTEVFPKSLGAFVADLDVNSNFSKGEYFT